tara:strand:+ start:46 stop:237 length:192 start_codon:yes stop_codon:yes gene_type:complete
MQPIYPNNKASSNLFKIDGSIKYIFTKYIKNKNIIFLSDIEQFIFILNHKYAKSAYKKYYFLK